MGSLFEGGPGHGKGSAVDSPMEISDRGHGTHGFTEWLAAYHGKFIEAPQRPAHYPLVHLPGLGMSERCSRGRGGIRGIGRVATWADIEIS